MSRRLLKDALYSVHKLFDKASDLSFSSRYDYEVDMRLFVAQLHEMGKPISNIQHLKKRYVEDLVQRWQQEGLSVGTLKNRLTKIRYVCRHINKLDITPTNQALNIGSRPGSRINRAIHDIDLTRFTHPQIRDSVTLQQLFGLRREESMKFIVSQADKGTHIQLKGSWTKGGIPRIVPVTTQAQLDFLDELRRRVPKGQSLIPPDKTYRDQRDVYKFQVRTSGYRNLHGLRHAYAQRRYQILTAQLSSGVGWASPNNGGPSAKEMTVQQRAIDRQARQVISEELGHSRIGITKVYTN